MEDVEFYNTDILGFQVLNWIITGRLIFCQHFVPFMCSDVDFYKEETSHQLPYDLS